MEISSVACGRFLKVVSGDFKNDLGFSHEHYHSPHSNLLDSMKPQGRQRGPAEVVACAYT